MIPSGFMLCEAIVCNVLHGCLAWPSVSSSPRSLNRLCWRNDWNKPVLYLLLALIFCLFVYFFGIILRTSRSPQLAGPAQHMWRTAVPRAPAQSRGSAREVEGPRGSSRPSCSQQSQEKASSPLARPIPSSQPSPRGSRRTAGAGESGTAPGNLLQRFAILRKAFVNTNLDPFCCNLRPLSSAPPRQTQLVCSDV